MSTESQQKCNKCLLWVVSSHEKYCGFCGNKLPEMKPPQKPSAPNIYGMYRFNGQEEIVLHHFGTIDPEKKNQSQQIPYQLQIYNPCSKALEIRVQSYPEWLHLSPETVNSMYVIESNQSLSIQIVPDFKKAVSGTHKDLVQLKTNDTRNAFRNIDIHFQINIQSPPSEMINEPQKINKEHHSQTSDSSVSDKMHDAHQDKTWINQSEISQEPKNKMEIVDILGEEYIEIPKANVKYLGIAEVTIQKFYVSKEPITYDNFIAVIEAFQNILHMSFPEQITKFQKLKNADPQKNAQGYVVNISWQDAIAYCNIKSLLYDLDNHGVLKKNKIHLDKIKQYVYTPNLSINQNSGFRLPTEFELKHIYDYLKTNNPLHHSFQNFFEFTSGSYFDLQDLRKFDGEENPLPFNQNLDKCIINILKIIRKSVRPDGQTIYKPLFRNVFQIN